MRLNFCITALLLSLLQHNTGTADEHVLQNAQNVVVKLFGAGGGNLDSYGTGVIVSAQGHVLTVASHLIITGGLTAVTADGQRLDAETMGTSLPTDTALLRLRLPEGQTLPFLDIQTAVEAAPGTPVLAFSNMFRVAAGNEPVSVVHGILAASVPLEAVQGRWSFPLQTPVWIIDAVTNNSGAAGGLLTDREGRPLGLLGREVRHKASRTWVNYAVPFTTLAPVVQQLLEGKSSRVIAENMQAVPPLTDRQLTAAFGLTLMPKFLQRTPAYIDNITAGSIAEAAGLRRGDLIVLIGDSVITDVNDVGKQVSGYRIGQQISVTVSRSEELITVELNNPAAK